VVQLNLSSFFLAGGIAVGAVASASALYGRYRVLPAALTGPSVCKLEAGGCQALFRTPTAALLGVPNSVLGLLFYGALTEGLLRGWPRPPLLCGASAAVAMSAYLALTLIKQGLECRVCWAGHVSNAAIWLALAAGLRRRDS